MIAQVFKKIWEYVMSALNKRRKQGTKKKMWKSRKLTNASHVNQYSFKHRHMQDNRALQHNVSKCIKRKMNKKWNRLSTMVNPITKMIDQDRGLDHKPQEDHRENYGRLAANAVNQEAIRGEM